MNYSVTLFEMFLYWEIRHIINVKEFKVNPMFIIGHHILVNAINPEYKLYFSLNKFR